VCSSDLCTAITCLTDCPGASSWWWAQVRLPVRSCVRMSELNAVLLTREVDGKGLSIRGVPQQIGARLSKNFKRVAAAALGLVSAGVLVGIFTAGSQPKGADDGSQGGTAASNGMVGQTQPDLDTMERNAKRVPHQPVVTGPNDLSGAGSPGANSDALVTSSASAGRVTLPVTQASDSPRQKYRQWLEEQQYKVLEGHSLAAQSATAAKLAPQGSERPSVGADASPMAANSDSPLSQLIQSARALQSSAGQAASLPSALASLAGSATGGLRTGEASIPSTAESQVANQAFLDHQSEPKGGGYLAAAVQPPASDHELFAGSVIPAVLVTSIQSDLPGSITAQVRQTVYDSRYPAVVLIPQGTRLIGLYTSQIAYGQRRVLVAWNRLIFPNGSTLELAGMEGTDSIGQAGFADQVNNHYERIFGSAVLMSMLGVGTQLSQPQNSSSFTSSSTSQQMAAAVANELNQAGTTLLNKNLAIQPTLTVRPGYAFDVLVNRSMVLPPYVDRVATLRQEPSG